MDDGTAIHNDVCFWFKDVNFSKQFIEKYIPSDYEKTKIKKIVLEDIVSNNNVLIGYCDVVIDYEDEAGNIQKLLIEVKSSASVINKDPMDVLRQIKKYRFYNKKITQVFLIYFGDSEILLEHEDLFTDEDITVLDISDMDPNRKKSEPEPKKKEYNFSGRGQ